MRHALMATALAATGILAAGAAAPAAMAADDCPNAAVRAQQHAQHLPNCMAYEKITPAEKGGAVPKVVAADPVRWDGNGVIISSPALSIGNPLNGLVMHYRAVRGPDGWQSAAMLPALSNRIPIGSDMFKGPFAQTSDLGRTIYGTEYPLHQNDQATYVRGANPARGMSDLYRLEPDGTSTWIVPDPSTPDLTVATADRPVNFAGADPDLERVVVRTARRFDDRVATTNTAQRVYVWTPAGMRMVSVLPDGRLPSGAATLPVADGVDYNVTAMRAVSEDARRVAFLATDGSSTKPYVRLDADDADRARTVELTLPSGAECFATAEDTPIISRDGSRVLYRCASGADQNLYIQRLDGGSSAVQELGAYTNLARAGAIRASDDLALVYARNPEAAGGLKVWRDAAPVIINAGWYGPANFPKLSRDGEYLVFESEGGDHPAIPGFDPGATQTQVYRLNARSGEMLCVSCRQDGTRTAGDGGFSGQDLTNAIRRPVVSDSGSVIFNSTDALVPGDSNGSLDAYAWVSGGQALLSGGRSSLPSAGAVVSQDGSTFFLSSPDALVPEDRDGGAYDVYAVRVNGGWISPDVSVPCESECRGATPKHHESPLIGSGELFAFGLNDSAKTGPATVDVRAARSVRTASATVRVRVSRPGRVRVSGVGIRAVTRAVRAPGTVRIAARLSAYGARQRRERGRMATRITVRFAPADGTAVSARRAMTFIRASKKGGR